MRGAVGNPGSGVRIIGHIVALMGQHRPDDSHIFVCQCDGSDVLVASRDEGFEPRIGTDFVFADAYHCSRTMDEQGPQVTIAALADALQNRFATGGMLSRYQPHPSCHLPTVFEVPGIADGRNQCAGGYRSYARHCSQLCARGTVAMPALDFQLQLANLLVERFEMLDERLQQMAKAHR